MKMNEKLMIYWTFNAIKNDFNIKSNERTMTMISTDIIVRIMSRASYKDTGKRRVN